MKLNFKSNSLSKGAFLRSMFQLLFFQSKNNQIKFKEQISHYFSISTEQVFLYGAGRMAVYSVLKALEVKEKDEVIVAGYTCVVLTNAVKFAGCKVKYVDIDRSTLNMNASALLTSISLGTKALIIPHNFGLVAEGIDEIKAKYPKLIIIEDAAHTFGSSDVNGNLAGKLGHFSFFSLEYSKPLTTGLGGILIVNDQKYIERVSKYYQQLEINSFKHSFKMICTLAVMNLCYSKSTTFFYTNGFRFLRLFKLVYQTSTDEINGILPKKYPVKLHPILTNFGYNQLKNIESINDRKRRIQQLIKKSLDQFHDIQSFEIENCILARYPILFNEQVSLETIDTIKKQALSNDFLFGEWFNDVVHPKGSFRYCYEEGLCTEGEYVAKRILNLPINVNYPVTESELSELMTIFKENGIT